MVGHQKVRRHPSVYGSHTSPESQYGTSTETAAAMKTRRMRGSVIRGAGYRNKMVASSISSIGPTAQPIAGSRPHRWDPRLLASHTTPLVTNSAPLVRCARTVTNRSPVTTKPTPTAMYVIGPAGLLVSDGHS